MQQRPLIGVGVMIVKEGSVLLGKRKNAHGQGYWAFPGGHLEFGESPYQCAQREVAEETGLSIANIYPIAFTNDIFSTEEKHYVTLFMRADWHSGMPQVLEPDKCEQWQWFKADALPEPLFLSIVNLIAANQGRLPLDYKAPYHCPPQLHQ